jgi:hypothetical protein
LEVSELVPAQPTTRRRAAHPIRKATTKAIAVLGEPRRTRLLACVLCY